MTSKHAALTDLQVENPDGPYRLEGYRINESLGFLIKRAGATLSSAIDQELAPYDITHPQFSILMMLNERRCSTAAELARETCGDTGAMTRMLDRLEAKNIVRRVRSRSDRRIVHIELTESGKLFAERMPVVAINVLNRYLQGFQPEELEQMKGLLRRIIAAGTPEASREESTPEAAKG